MTINLHRIRELYDDAEQLGTHIPKYPFRAEYVCADYGGGWLADDEGNTPADWPSELAKAKEQFGEINIVIYDSSDLKKWMDKKFDNKWNISDLKVILRRCGLTEKDKLSELTFSEIDALFRNELMKRDEEEILKRIDRCGKRNVTLNHKDREKIGQFLNTIDKFLEQYNLLDIYFHQMDTCVQPSNLVTVMWWPAVLKKDCPIPNTDLFGLAVRVVYDLEAIRSILYFIFDADIVSYAIDKITEAAQKIGSDFNAIQTLYLENHEKHSIKDWLTKYNKEGKTINRKFVNLLHQKRRVGRMEQAGNISKVVNVLGLRELAGQDQPVTHDKSDDRVSADTPIPQDKQPAKKTVATMRIQDSDREKAKRLIRAIEGFLCMYEEIEEYIRYNLDYLSACGQIREIMEFINEGKLYDSSINLEDALESSRGYLYRNQSESPFVVGKKIDKALAIQSEITVDLSNILHAVSEITKNKNEKEIITIIHEALRSSPATIVEPPEYAPACLVDFPASHLLYHSLFRWERRDHRLQQAALLSKAIGDLGLWELAGQEQRKELRSQIVPPMVATPHISSDISDCFKRIDSITQQLVAVRCSVEEFERIFLNHVSANGPFSADYQDNRFQCPWNEIDDGDTGESIDIGSNIGLLTINYFETRKRGQIRCEFRRSEKHDPELDVSWWLTHEIYNNWKKYKQMLFGTWEYSTGEYLGHSVSDAKAYWFLGDPSDVSYIREYAKRVEQNLVPLSANKEYSQLANDIMEIVYNGHPGWFPGQIRWTYIKDLDAVIKKIENLIKRQTTLGALMGQDNVPDSGQQKAMDEADGDNIGDCMSRSNSLTSALDVEIDLQKPLSTATVNNHNTVPKKRQELIEKTDSPPKNDSPQVIKIDRNDLKRLEKQKKRGGWNMLVDLINSPDQTRGIQYKSSLHGEKQPDNLKGVLKRKGYKEAAKIIHAGDGNIYVEQGYRLEFLKGD